MPQVNNFLYSIPGIQVLYNITIKGINISKTSLGNDTKIGLDLLYIVICLTKSSILTKTLWVVIFGTQMIQQLQAIPYPWQPYSLTRYGETCIKQPFIRRPP